MKTDLRDMQGFSLIEVLLAVTIIGLIAAAAVPKAAHFMAVSRTQRVIADLQTLDAAVVMYETEKGAPPKAVGDLKDYVRSIDKVKPPKDSTIIVKGAEEKVTDSLYTLTDKGTDGIRASLGKYTSDDLLPEAGR